MWYAGLIRVLVQLLGRSLRIRTDVDAMAAEALKPGRPGVIVFWHGSMLFSWWWFRCRNGAALVSRSKDGELLARVLSGWGYRLVRGSSSAGGKDAMKLMEDAVGHGYRMCVTPDGPRGPRHVMKMGAVRLAQKTGVPLLLFAVGFKSYWSLRSWDGFQIPKPWTKAIVMIRCIPIEELAPENGDLEPVRQEISRRLNEMNDEALRLARETR